MELLEDREACKGVWMHSDMTQDINTTTKVWKPVASKYAIYFREEWKIVYVLLEIWKKKINWPKDKFGIFPRMCDLKFP